jgi:hypothetical protein
MDGTSRTTPPDELIDLTDDATDPAAAVEAVADRLLHDTATTLELLAVHVGLELGLYAALAEHGPATPEQLADRAGIAPRYAREWLEQQTAAGNLVCLDPTAAPDARSFVLPAAVATVLLDPAGGAHLGPIVSMVRSMCDVLGPLLDAYRTGGGVPFEAYGAHLRHGLGALNGPTFDTQLATWLQGLPDVHNRLRTGELPRILDLGCGIGRSTWRWRGPIRGRSCTGSTSTSTRSGTPGLPPPRPVSPTA